MTEKGVDVAPIYEPPILRVLGSVTELTQQVNKVGPNADALVSPEIVVGSVVPVGGG
ncbi:MAG: lasso RiPP family leader peptide-containing protein [Acidimicrobiia bacterium]